MKTTFLLTTALLLIFFIAGCSDKESGIFYSVEEEREVEDNTIDNNATIGGMVTFAGSYYAAAGEIFKVSASENLDYHLGDSGGKWKIEAGTPSNTLCNSISTLNGELYGVFYSKNTSNADFTSDLFIKDGSDWTKVAISGAAEDFQVVKILGNESDDLMFLLGYSYNTDGNPQTKLYTIYSYEGTTFSDISSGFGNITTASTFDLAIDGDSSGNQYWIICGPRLFTLPVSSPTSDLTELVDSTLENTGGYDTDDTFKGIHHTEIFGGLILSKKDKTGYFRPDDGDWDKLDNTFSNEPEDFLDFIQTDGTDALIVGSSSGYFELAGDDIDGYDGDFSDPFITVKASTYKSLDLDAATVLSFFKYTVYDGTADEADVFFALTRDSGLWSNGDYDSSETYRVWDIE